MAQQQQNDPLLILQAELAALRQQIATQNDEIQQNRAQITVIPDRQAPVAPRIKPDHPPPFSGRKTKSLEAWIFQMQQFCTLTPVPQADHITFAATFFKDQAAL